MENRIALLKNDIVFNIIIGTSAEEMAALFNCQAIEITPETGQAYIGYGFSNNMFVQAPLPPDPEPILEPDAPVVSNEE
jgi:hypothetical protein